MIGQQASWLLIGCKEWTTNQKSGQQVDPTLDNDYNSQIFASGKQGNHLAMAAAVREPCDSADFTAVKEDLWDNTLQAEVETILLE